MVKTPILALDIATVTGFALRTPDALIVGTRTFSSRPNAGAGERFLDFQNFLHQTWVDHGVETIVFEELMGEFGRPGQSRTHQLWGGLFASLAMWAEDKPVGYFGVNVKRIKKHATGNGNAKKEDMVKVAKLMFHYEQDKALDGIGEMTHDAADAYLLLKLVESEGFRP